MYNIVHVPAAEEAAPSAVELIPESVFTAIYILLAILAFTYLAAPSIDAREPPVVWPRLPVIGHMAGLFNTGPKYFQRPFERLDAPIITLPMATGRMYATKSRELINQIMRNHKALAFKPFAAPLILNVTGSGAHASSVVKDNMMGDTGGYSYWSSVTQRIKVELSSGGGLAEMERRIYCYLSAYLVADQQGCKGTVTVDLMESLRIMFSKGTFSTLYGDSHPYNSNELYRADCAAFEDGLNGLLFGKFPRLIARRAYNARERIVRSMTKYMQNGLPSDASGYIRARYEEGIKAGLSAAEIARFETLNILASIGNSVPASFWLLVHIWSTPGLVEELREEIIAVLQLADPNHRPKDPLPASFLSSLGRRVPLLKAAFDETLRVHSNSSSFRQVMEDTTLQDSERVYLLKKDAFVVIPNAVLHSDRTAFPEPQTWNPRRFQASHDEKGKESKAEAAPRPAELRPWGGGHTMCPGRFFATAEILGIVALYILGFDATAVDAHGIPQPHQPWTLPADYPHNQAASIYRPCQAVRVRLHSRPGWNIRVNADK